MTYTNHEYAEMADRANRERKILTVIDGVFVLEDPPPLPKEDADHEKSSPS